MYTHIHLRIYLSTHLFIYSPIHVFILHLSMHMRTYVHPSYIQILEWELGLALQLATLIKAKKSDMSKTKRGHDATASKGERSVPKDQIVAAVGVKMITESLRTSHPLSSTTPIRAASTAVGIVGMRIDASTTGTSTGNVLPTDENNGDPAVPRPAPAPSSAVPANTGGTNILSGIAVPQGENPLVYLAKNEANRTRAKEEAWERQRQKAVAAALLATHGMDITPPGVLTGAEDKDNGPVWSDSFDDALRWDLQRVM